MHVTRRPEPPPWPFTGMSVGFGDGRLFCVESSYADWAIAASANPTVERDPAAALVHEGAKRGSVLEPTPPLIGWALARHPARESAPEGYRLELVDDAWMTTWQERDVFPNALGLAIQVHRTYRNTFAYVLVDETDSPVAAAGAFDTAGLQEIGVDVLAGHRGRGLGAAAVRAVCVEILARDGTPFYSCQIGNIRSQHTALSAGFRPVCAYDVVMEAGVGLA